MCEIMPHHGMDSHFFDEYDFQYFPCVCSLSHFFFFENLSLHTMFLSEVTITFAIELQDPPADLSVTQLTFSQVVFFAFLASLACLSVLLITFLFFIFHYLLLINSQIKVSNSGFKEAIHTLVVFSAGRMAVWYQLVLPEPEMETSSPFLYSNKEKENQ